MDQVEDDVENHQSNGAEEGANELDDYEDEDGFDDDDDEEEEEDDGNQNPHSQRHAKKRKLQSLASNYEFAPRAPPPQPELTATAGPSPAPPKPSFGGRNAQTDWTEAETAVLLDAWGDWFLQYGRKSLRSEEWHEVAEKVLEVSKVKRTEMQCRNRVDTLKKKYKKEKLKLTSEWVYFRKMDTLMSSPPQKRSFMAVVSSHGMDSGGFVAMDPKVYLNRANGMYDDDDEEEDESDGLPTKKRRCRRESNKGSPFKLLAESILKITDMYEKIEKRKSRQMVEIERMRMKLERELEVQRRKIVERAHAEIAKIMEDDYDEDDHDQ